MAARPRGQVVERYGNGGRTYAIRFSASGRRRYLTLGREYEGWTRRRHGGTRLADRRLRARRSRFPNQNWSPAQQGQHPRSRPRAGDRASQRAPRRSRRRSASRRPFSAQAASHLRLTIDLPGQGGRGVLKGCAQASLFR